jgi:hypothetical protein
MSASSGPTALLVRWLERLSTPDEVRDYLQTGLETHELTHVGFDQVTIAQCMDDVVSALEDHRQHHGDAVAAKTLTDAAAAYLAARAEAAVRRVAGAATCLPPPR